MRSLSEIFTDLDVHITTAQIEHVTIKHLIDFLHERGFGFILLMLSIPMALPIPVPPGINILLASPLILLCAQQAIGRRSVWLPNWMMGKGISKKRMKTIIHKTIPWFKRIEKICKPRFALFTSGMASHIVGILGLIMALAICIPLPLTNTVPSLGIALMSIGLIMRDGLAVFAGALIGTLWVCMISIITAILLYKGIALSEDMMKSLLR